MKLTQSTKKSDVKGEWLVVDATDLPLGRLASVIAFRLKGKHRADYTPHVAGADSVVVVNAQRVRLTGRKIIDSEFHRHTGHPGGIKSITPWQELTGRFPERVVERAVERMLPKTTQGRELFTRLFVYPGAKHPHEAQQPKAWDVGAQIAKKNWQ